MPIDIDKQEQPEIRQLSPETFWGGSLALPDNLSDEVFTESAKNVAKKTGFTFSGYNIEGPQGKEYHFSRYPRRAFGQVPSVETHQSALRQLGEILGIQGQEENLSEIPRFRVLLGLEEGYAEYKKSKVVKSIEEGKIETLQATREALAGIIENPEELGDDLNTIKSRLGEINLGKTHSPEEVKEALGEGFSVTPASINSVGSWGNYTEPSVVIEGDPSNLQQVIQLAEKFHQARIAVEDLQKGISYMVETKWCEDPDKE